jgi:predicted Zn-dependent peptidase
MILHSTVLENGLKVFVHEAPYLRTVSLGIWVDQGSKDETDQTNGLSHLIEHLLFNIPPGDERQHPLASELQTKGARFNATTTREFTYFYITLMASHAALGFETLATMVQQTEIAPEVLERERQVVLHEHRMVMNSADQVHDRFAQSLWGDHYLGRMVIGREEVIRNADLSQIQEYIAMRYSPDNACLVIVGGMGHTEAFRLAEDHFGRWAAASRRPRPQALQYDNSIIVIPSGSDEVSLCMGVNGVSEDDPDRYAVELLALVLGGSDQSRLYQAIRNKRRLAYAVTAYAHFFRPAGLIACMVRCHRQDVPEVVHVIGAEFGRLKAEPITPQELTHVREVGRTEAFMRAENSMNLMRLIGRNAMLGKNYTVNGHVRAIQSVEADEIQEAAKRLFHKRDLGLAVVGNVAEDDLLHALAGSDF